MQVLLRAVFGILGNYNAVEARGVSLDRKIATAHKNGRKWKCNYLLSSFVSCIINDELREGIWKNGSKFRMLWTKNGEK